MSRQAKAALTTEDFSVLVDQAAHYRGTWFRRGLIGQLSFLSDESQTYVNFQTVRKLSKSIEGQKVQGTHLLTWRDGPGLTGRVGCTLTPRAGLGHVSFSSHWLTHCDIEG